MWAKDSFCGNNKWKYPGENLMKKTVMFFLAVILLAITSVIVINVKTASQYVLMEPETMHISSVKIDDSSLSLSGEFVLDSARVYKKHICDIIDGTAYIKVYGSYSRGESEFGGFDFTVSDDFSEVREVVMVGEIGNMTLLSWEAEENALARIYPIHCIEDIDYFLIFDNYTVIHLNGDLNYDFYRMDTRGIPVLSSVDTKEAYSPVKAEKEQIEGLLDKVKAESGDNWRVDDGSPIRLYLNGEYFGAHRYNDPVYELYDYLHTLFGIDMKEYNYA